MHGIQLHILVYNSKLQLFIPPLPYQNFCAMQGRARLFRRMCMYMFIRSFSEKSGFKQKVPYCTCSSAGVMLLFPRVCDVQTSTAIGAAETKIHFSLFLHNIINTTQFLHNSTKLLTVLRFQACSCTIVGELLRKRNLIFFQNYIKSTRKRSM